MWERHEKFAEYVEKVRKKRRDDLLSRLKDEAERRGL
jgi:hypothetical protein